MPLISVITKAVREPEFRSQFIANPKTVLRDMAVEVPPDQNVTVLESQEGKVFFVLPLLSETDIQQLKESLDTVHPHRSVRSRILLKSAQDPAYKARLLQEPKAVLQDEGIAIPTSAELTLLENSPQQLYIVLPHVHQ
ncbi:MAG: NHLP leader peptide family RiPP precursor [Thermosynechococcaceae cyanobacterium]